MDKIIKYLKTFEKLSKTVIAKKIGKRREYFFSVGETNFSDSITIFEDDKFLILTEEKELEIVKKLKVDINRMMRNES